MINSEFIRNKIKNSSAYGVLISVIGAIGIFLYAIYNPNKIIKEKKEGDNFVTIQLSAFAPPSKDPIAEQIQKPKPKHKHKNHKKHKNMVEAPPKPFQTPIQAMEKPQEKVKEEVDEQPNDVTQEVKDDVKIADVTTTVQSSKDSNEEQNIKILRFSDGIDNAFLRAIRTAIQKQHQYPNLAEKRRFEGEVLVRFLINADGQVSKIQVIRACPYSILNKAAVKTIQRSSKDFPKPSKSIYIEIPVTYALNH